MKIEKECKPSVVRRYRAVRKPQCRDGKGCHRCWGKYNMTHWLTRDHPHRGQYNPKWG